MPRVETAHALAEHLAEVELPLVTPGREGETPTKIGSLWSDQPLVLVHLRHFGCVLCRQFAAQVQAHLTEFRGLGMRVVAIGTGGTAYAHEFIEEQGIEYELMCDKGLQSHDVLGVKSGPPLGVLKPKVLFAAAKAMAAGHRFGETGEHPFVFAAAHVFERGGRPVFAWLNDDYQDNPPIEVVLEAAREASSATVFGSDTRPDAPKR